MGNKKLFFFMFFFLVEFIRGQGNRKTQVNVGVVTDVGVRHSEIGMRCINMSLSDFYSSHPQFQTRLVLNIGDSREDVVGAADASIELIKNTQVKAILGPWTSMQAHFMIEISQKTRVPLVSYSATSPFLSSLRSPYFFRATYEDSSQVNAIKAIIKLFGWREVVPVYIDNTFGEGIMPRLTDALQEINVRIPHRSVIALNATDSEISVELLTLMNMPTRVFIVHMFPSLATRFFIKAKELGLMKPRYVWILTNGVTDVLSLIKETGKEAMEGVLGVKTYIPESKDLDKFKARWRKRFPQVELNVYDLWAYDAITALAKAVEEAGTQNLTFSNANAGKNVSEIQALGVSHYGPKLLETLSRVQFKGLSGDFRFVNRQLQPSVFEIVNVVGRGENSIGFWTKENVLVKKLNQKPQSMSALSTWKDHLKPITWPGHATSIPKGWEIPTNGRRLRIGVPKKSGYTDLVKVTRDPITNASIVTGFCIDFFEAVIRELPYDISYELFPFETSDGQPAGNYNDLVYEVYLGRYDAVVGDTTVVANRSFYVDFTFPFIKSGVGLIVPVKDVVKRDKFSFLKPLSWKLWLTSFFSFFIIGFTVWFVESKNNEEFGGPLHRQASTIFWFSFSTMVFAPRERVWSFGARLLVIAWYFLVLILTQSYTASLASLLTSQQLNPTITSMRSLLERRQPVGYQRRSFTLGKLTEAGFSQSNLIPFDGSEDLDELLRKGPEQGGISGAFLEIPYLRLFLGQYCTYKMVEDSFNVDGFGFVFPIGSPLVSDVSRAILKVAESPKAKELDRAWFKKKDENCPDPVTYPNPNPFFTSRQLGLDCFWVLFVIVLGLCIFALSEDGDIFDCVDIHKQPAFDHPALKNHKIQMKPTVEFKSKKKSMDINGSSIQITSQIWTKSGTCPVGTIPVRRVSREDISRASSPYLFGRKTPYKYNIRDKAHPRNITLNNQRPQNRSEAVLLAVGFNYIGAESDINVWNPPGVEDDDYSSAQIWLTEGETDMFESIEAGWMVNPGVFGDTLTRLFAYWTTDGYHNTGCFNLLCSGFVQTSPNLALGGAIKPVTTNWKMQYYISISMFLDPNEGTWWLRFNDIVLGYWPSELLIDLRRSATAVQWGGEVYSPNVRKKPHTRTSMGSGQWATQLYGNACFHTNIRIMDYSLQIKYPNFLADFSDEGLCYSTILQCYDKKEPFFYFGGPGHNPKCP
ncbi:unnamed protein product [Cochlearia groenlandica]